jgi:hypothetical protein
VVPDASTLKWWVDEQRRQEPQVASCERCHETDDVIIHLGDETSRPVIAEEVAVGPNEPIEWSVVSVEYVLFVESSLRSVEDEALGLEVSLAGAAIPNCAARRIARGLLHSV